MRLLCLSNGHGEDQIALRILAALRDHAPQVTIDVLPIVGDGQVYTKAGFNLVGPVQMMPSGGFINMDSRQLARDVQAGLLKLTWGQIQAVRAWRRSAMATQSAPEPCLILAVGDIVPLLFGWMSGVAFAFVGTAKSEYYLRDESGWLTRSSWWDDRFLRWTGCVYLPWERWLMRHWRCAAVFPRDRLTTENLQRFTVPALDLGNPMMDGLGAIVAADRPVPPDPQTMLTIALLPGSRFPEAYENWQRLIASIQHLSSKINRPVRLLAALTPASDRQQILASLQDWQQFDADSFRMNEKAMSEKNHVTELTLYQGKFVECIRQSHLAIAMAGTATEQFVGLGKPVVTIPGNGPQFVPVFAEAQTRLLGNSVHLVEDPTQVPDVIQELLATPERWADIAANGQRRMGDPGAAQRIAEQLLRLQWSGGACVE
jgi:uncharacterized protein (TIGR03492 family)